MDLAHQQAPQLVVLVHVAVRVAEEDRLVRAEDGAGCALLVLADAREVLRGDLGILRTLVAAGGDDHVDVPAARTQEGQRPAAGELSVVGVGEHGERTLRRLRLELVEEVALRVDVLCFGVATRGARALGLIRELGRGLGRHARSLRAGDHRAILGDLRRQAGEDGGNGARDLAP